MDCGASCTTTMCTGIGSWPPASVIGLNLRTPRCGALRSGLPRWSAEYCQRNVRAAATRTKPPPNSDYRHHLLRPRLRRLLRLVLTHSEEESFCHYITGDTGRIAVEFRGHLVALLQIEAGSLNFHRV